MRCKGVMEISSVTWSLLIAFGDVIVTLFIGVKLRNLRETATRTKCTVLYYLFEFESQ
jgi:hypothetical protein